MGAVNETLNHRRMGNGKVCRLIMEGVDEGKACSGNALMIPRDLCHSLLKHLFAKAEDIPQSFVTEPEGYKMILNVAEAIRDSAESKD